jgi:hypothetical protein
MAYEKKLLESTYQELVRIQGTEQIVSGGGKLRFNPEKLKKAPLLDQLGREITNGEAPVPAKLALQYREISLDTGPIVFSGGVPVGGYANGGLFPNGAWNFSGHLHDSGFPSYDVAVAIAVRLGGVTFVVSIQGHVAGTIGSGSRDFNWDTSGTNPALAQALPVDDYDWSWNAAANINIGDLINSVTGAVGAAGKIIALL